MKKLFILLSIALATQTNAQTITGGDMETWKTYTVGFSSQQRPDAWFSTDSLIGFIKSLSLKSYSQRVTKSTTVKNGGTASAMLVSADPSVDSLPTILANGNIKFNLTDIVAGDFSKINYIGGTNVTKRIVFAHAYTQYTTTSADTGQMTVTAFKNGAGVGGTDSAIGSGSKLIMNSSSFVKQTCGVSYNDATMVPDRIVITFTTSRKTVPVKGTTLYVDDVTISDPTGIETPIFNDQNIKVYPNPAQNQLFINTDLKVTLNVQLFNALGQLVLNQKFNQNATINLSPLAIGNYNYVISGEDGHRYYAATITKQ